jgi:hypothetical protein
VSIGRIGESLGRIGESSGRAAESLRSWRANRSWRGGGWNRLARAAPDANAVTQVLPVVRADAPPGRDDDHEEGPVEPAPVGARHPAGRDLTWARHSYQGQRRTSTPISRPRLMIVFGLVAATALATVVTLVGGETPLPEPSPDSDDSLLIAPGVPGDDPPMPIVPPPPPSPTGPSDETQPSASARPSRTPPSSTPAPTRSARASKGVRTRPAASPSAVPGRTGSPGGSSSAGRLAAPVSFEAESGANTLGGAAETQSAPRASGGRVVANLGRAGSRPEGWLRFNGVRAPSAGRYALTVYYLSAAASAATVRVNGQSLPAPMAFPPASSVTSVTVVVSLRGGTNAIQFGNPAGVAPSIDRVTVRAA